MPRGTFFRRTMVVVTLALPLFACSTDREKAQSHRSQAEAYLKEGKPREALLELRNALKLEPKSADTNYRIAQILVEQRSYSDALFFLRETQRLDPARTDAPLDEAKLLLSEDTARAEELVKGALQREPSNPMVHLRRMEVALHKGDTGEALAAAKTAVELAPEDPLYHMQVGIVRQAQVVESRAMGKQPPEELFEQALAAYRKADELYGGNPAVRTNIGKLYLSWKDHPDEARAAFRGAIEAANEKGILSDRQQAARSGLDYARIANDPEFGLFALEQLLEADPSNLEAWAQLASAREQGDGSGDAVWQRLLSQKPDDLDVHWRYAIWLFANEKGDAAKAHLAALAGKASDRARALEMLSGIQLQMLQNEEAKATIASLEKEFPGDPSTQLAAARLASIEGRYADAAPLLRAFVGKRENAEAFRLLALSELYLGNPPAAVAAVDRSIALSSGTQVETLALKARILHASRDWPLAVQTYTQLLQTGATLPPRDLVLFASALYEANRPIGARQVLEGILALPDPPVLAAIEYANREGAKSPEAARKHLEAAFARAPKHPGLVNALTRIDLQAGRTREAKERLDTLIESGEAPAVALLARARILAGERKFAEAEQDVNRVFEAAPNLAGTLELLIQIYAAQDKLDAAIASFEEADRAGALSPGARLLLGRLYLSQGDRKRARETIEQALAERGDLGGAKNDLAFLLALEGVELDRALNLAQEAQQAMADDPSVADTLGFVYLKKGLSEPALQQIRYAIQLNEEAGQPAQPVFQYHLGLVLRSLGRNDEAVAAFEQALGMDPNFAEAAETKKELEAARAAMQAAPSAS